MLFNKKPAQQKTVTSDPRLLQAQKLLQEQKLQQGLDLLQVIWSENKSDKICASMIAKVLIGIRKLPELVAFYEMTYQSQPDNHELYDLCTGALVELGEIKKAEERFDKAYQTRSRDLTLLTIGANIKGLVGKTEEQDKILNKLLMQDPTNINYLSMKAVIAHSGREFHRAIRLQEKIVKDLERLGDKSEIYTKTLNNLANSYKDIGDVAKSVELYEKALEIDPKNIVVWTNLLLAENYLSEDCSKSHNRYREAFRTSKLFPRFGNVKDPNKKLRVGFISYDFRRHSVGYFMLPIFEFYNKDEFELIPYIDAPVMDDFTKKFMESSYDFRLVSGTSADELAKIIQADHIDVMFDLSGSTGYNRADLFRNKVAPVVISYLGYCNTSAFHTVDYKILDRITAPEGISDELHEEKILRMSKTYIVYPKIPDIVRELEPPVVKNGFITFLVTNYPAKFTEEIYVAWSEILKRVPNSRIFFKYSNFTDIELQDKVRDKLVNLGIDSSRIDIKGFTETHMDEYNKGDICLDTFPYCGTTTTMDALTMGVPTITIMGKVHHSRIGGLLNSLIEMPNLIAHDIHDYVEKAVDCANNVEFLKDFRVNCETWLDKSPIRDYQGFTDEFFANVRGVWSKYCMDYN
jgi:protein O-GlcNAc transferase